MRRALLAAVHVVTGAAGAALDAPARLRGSVRRLDMRAVQLLDPPVVAVEPEPTVPEHIQYRLRSTDEWIERQAALLANLHVAQADLAARKADLAARILELDERWAQMGEQEGWN